MKKSSAPSFLELFQSGKSISYRKNEIITRPDDAPSGVYYIEDGFVKVYSITEDGDEKLHIIYKTGQVFPLMWALENIHKDVYYQALTNVKLKRVSKEFFNNFIQKNPTINAELVDRLVFHFNVFVDRVDNLEIAKAYPRLVAQILFLAKRFGKQRGKKILIDIPLAHKDIANMINMTRETASREFEKLEKRGLIAYEKHLIVVNNIPKLEEELTKHYEREPI